MHHAYAVLTSMSCLISHLGYHKSDSLKSCKTYSRIRHLRKAYTEGSYLQYTACAHPSVFPMMEGGFVTFYLQSNLSTLSSIQWHSLILCLTFAYPCCHALPPSLFGKRIAQYDIAVEGMSCTLGTKTSAHFPTSNTERN